MNRTTMHPDDEEPGAPRRMLLPLLLSSLLGGALTPLAGCTRSEASGLETVRVARGEYLVSTAGCHDCHTPLKMGPNGPERDYSRMLSGHPEQFIPGPPPAMVEGWNVAMVATGTAFHGPWGTSFAANLTPHPVTGLGPWTEEIFMQAIREGRHWGVSRPILPPMPWDVYRNLTDEDLKSIFAYLRTIPPVRNEVPLPLPPPGSDS